jgi:spermidine synthase
MHKYDGLVVYQNHDDEGILEVVEERGVRSLHFGSSAKQSSMSLSQPDALQLPYVRAMASCLLFKETLDSVLVVGLGGGSLTRFVLHHFPECRVRAVECRASVVKIARSHFGLPLDSRLKVVVEDGGDYIRQQALGGQNRYDVIFLDAFDDEGMSDSIASVSFFDACKALLRPDGILVINLWGSQAHLYASCVEWLQRTFTDKVLALPVRQRGNVVAFAFNHGVARFEMKPLQHRAKVLEQRFDVEFPVFLKDFNKHNAYAIHNIVTK